MTLLSEERDTFALRYYRWSYGRLLDELATGFALVVDARVKSGVDYAAAMARTVPSEQNATAIACLKRFHCRGAEVSGEALSAKEEALLQAFDALRAEVSADQRLRAFTRGTLFRARQGAAQTRRRLVKQAKDELRDALGEPEGGDRTSRLWAYRSEVNGHLVETLCDATGSERHYDFACGHRISANGGEPRALLANWMSWLGISSVCEWRLDDEDEVPLVIAAVKSAACECFEALPRILGQ